MDKNPAAVELGRLGGRVSSEAKTRAVRANAVQPRTRYMLRLLHDAIAREAAFRLALLASSRRESLAVRNCWWSTGALPY